MSERGDISSQDSGGDISRLRTCVLCGEEFYTCRPDAHCDCFDDPLPTCETECIWNHLDKAVELGVVTVPTGGPITLTQAKGPSDV